MPRRIGGPCTGAPGCPNLAGKCEQHKRGTTTQRGYGGRHQELRRQWQQRIDQGVPVACWRCGQPLTGTAWHLGHEDADRRRYRGPECIPCSTATAGR